MSRPYGVKGGSGWGVIFSFHSGGTPQAPSHLGWLMSKTKRISESLEGVGLCCRWIPSVLKVKGSGQSVCVLLKVWGVGEEKGEGGKKDFSSSPAVVTLWLELKVEFESMFPNSKGYFDVKQCGLSELSDQIQ